MKFDVIIGNPPYNCNLHLKFLEKDFDISAGIISIVHPGSWLYTQKPRKKGSLKLISDNIKKQ